MGRWKFSIAGTTFIFSSQVIHIGLLLVTGFVGVSLRTGILLFTKNICKKAWCSQRIGCVLKIFMPAYSGQIPNIHGWNFLNYVLEVMKEVVFRSIWGRCELVGWPVSLLITCYGTTSEIMSHLTHRIPSVDIEHIFSVYRIRRILQLSLKRIWSMIQILAYISQNPQSTLLMPFLVLDRVQAL